MLKRFCLVIIFCLFSFITEASSGYGFASYPMQMEETVKIISQLPEAAALIQRVNREGPIRLKIDSRTPYQAYWDSPTRTIGVNPELNPSKGCWISSILFELHNASSDNQLYHVTTLAVRGKIGKAAYVEGIERLEHDNALQTCIILKKGIQKQLFPQSADWNVLPSFEEHYALQQKTGHSEYIAAAYDRMRRQPRKGPLKVNNGSFGRCGF